MVRSIYILLASHLSVLISLSLLRFDIYSFGGDGPEDEVGMRATVQSITQLITAEVDAGIPASRIVLGGFSQGGAMTILTGLTTEYKLAGLLVLSGWVPLAKTLKPVSVSQVMMTAHCAHRTCVCRRSRSTQRRCPFSGAMARAILS